MPLRRVVRRWRQQVVNQGWAAAATLAVSEMRGVLRQRGRPGTAGRHEQQNAAVHSFDQANGLDTSGLIWGEELPGGSANDAWNTAYYGIAPSVFHAVVRQLPEDARGATFIDLGSGKGRALLMASEYAFARVIGVEIAPALHKIALRNVTAWSSSHPTAAPIELVLRDAAEYSFPSGPLVVYLYHPFCRPVLQQVLRNLESALESEPREAYVLYINAELKQVVEQAAFLQPLWQQTLAMDSADRLADRAGSTREECVLYRARISGLA